ncbi:hypothetical protein LAV73_15280 [Lysinibacillus xylanilyticus]|uniref:hypothetical protein n=1 Tax=Lysinibacillus xylanilyticus TaxID=582475 RepID=UPI002B244129|nr:hypothetical protein [Lysinibacillus xylanilyticus]MEB2281344.1 hypothetical protein [Lysinibacillus xylanilyticus]
MNTGHPIHKIAQRLNTSKVSVALIAMDLEMTGKIGQNKKEPSPKKEIAKK